MNKYPTLEQLKNLGMIPCDAEYTVNGIKVYIDIDADNLDAMLYSNTEEGICYHSYHLDDMRVVEYLQGSGRTWVSLVSEAN